MKINAIFLHTEMGRRVDDFSADIIDAAVSLLQTAGFQAAESYLDENLIDFDITRRVLAAAPHRRRSADTASLVRFEAGGQRRRLAS